MRVEVRSGRGNVFEVALLLVTLIAGIAGLILGAPVGSSLSRVAPGGWGSTFYAISAFGALVTLVGIYLPSSRRPLRWEVAGLVAVSSTWLPYGGALLYSGPPGLATGSLLIGFGTACALRIVQIRKEVRQSRGLSALITYSERDP